MTKGMSSSLTMHHDQLRTTGCIKDWPMDWNWDLIFDGSVLDLHEV